MLHKQKKLAEMKATTEYVKPENRLTLYKIKTGKKYVIIGDKIMKTLSGNDKKTETETLKMFTGL